LFTQGHASAGHLYALENGGLVVRKHLEAFVDSDADYWTAWSASISSTAGRAKKAGIPLVHYPEIRSHWLGAPANGSRYAITHPHKDLASGVRSDAGPSVLAESIRRLLASCIPPQSVVAVVAHALVVGQVLFGPVNFRPNAASGSVVGG